MAKAPKKEVKRERFLEVLTESDNPKPCAVILKDGTLAGPGKVVAESALRGGADAYDNYMGEKPPRVKKAKGD